MTDVKCPEFGFTFTPETSFLSSFTVIFSMILSLKKEDDKTRTLWRPRPTGVWECESVQGTPGEEHWTTYVHLVPDDSRGRTFRDRPLSLWPSASRRRVLGRQVGYRLCTRGSLTLENFRWVMYLAPPILWEGSSRWTTSNQTVRSYPC